MDPAITAALIVGSIGAGGLGVKLLEHMWPLIAGRGDRRRDELDRAWAARDRAWKERDYEARKRRTAEEFAAKCVRRLIEAPCVPAESIPEWPASLDTGPTPTKETDQ